MSDEINSRTSLENNPIHAMDEFFETRGNSIYEMYHGMDALQDDEDTADDYDKLESIQPFVRKYSDLFRSARRLTEQGLAHIEATGGMGGIKISDTPLEESETLADFLIASGGTNLNSLDFFSDLNEVSLAYDDFIQTVLEDKKIAAVAKTIPISAEAMRLKKHLKENEDYPANHREALSDLVGQLDRNQRVFQVLDSRDVKLESSTFNKKVELTMKLQEYFLKMEKTYKFGNDKNEHRKNFGIFMARFFDAMEADYHLPSEYNSFLRAQERGILSSVQSMIFLEDRGFEIIPVDQIQDTEFKIDFLARKDGVEYAVQAKAANRAKVRQSLDGTVVYADNKHLPDIVAIDNDFEPIYAMRAPKEANPKLTEFMRIHDNNVNENEGWLWIEVDPYVGISEKVLQRTGRIKQAA